MSDLEIVITAICGVAVLGIIIFYILSHAEAMEFLKRVGMDILDMAAGIMFMVTFTVFDLITDMLNFFLSLIKTAKSLLCFKHYISFAFAHPRWCVFIFCDMRVSCVVNSSGVTKQKRCTNEKNFQKVNTKRTSRAFKEERCLQSLEF
eukprot:UN26648